MDFSLDFSPYRRRVYTLVLSIFIPVICFFIGLFTDFRSNHLKPKFGFAYLVCFTFLPSFSISAPCLCLLKRIRSSYKSQKSLCITLGSFTASCLISYATPIASTSSIYASINSILFIFWAWLVENALGISTSLGMVSGCSTGSVNFAKAIAVERQNPYLYLLVLIPVFEFYILTSLQWFYGPKWLPDDPPSALAKMAAEAALLRDECTRVHAVASKDHSKVNKMITEMLKIVKKSQLALVEADAAANNVRRIKEEARRLAEAAVQDARAVYNTESDDVELGLQRLHLP